MSTIKTTNIQHPSAASPAVELTAAGGLWLAGGKILQVVRATDSTGRSTSSTSFVDVTGMSVTITPQKSDSVILVAAYFTSSTDTGAGNTTQAGYTITDSSNNSLSGAETHTLYISIGGASTALIQAPVALLGYSTPATTSAVTYKLRFRRTTGTTYIRNNEVTGQMYAIEVSA